MKLKKNKFLIFSLCILLLFVIAFITLLLLKAYSYLSILLIAFMIFVIGIFPLGMVYTMKNR